MPNQLQEILKNLPTIKLKPGDEVGNWYLLTPSEVRAINSVPGAVADLQRRLEELEKRTTKVTPQ